MPIIIVFSVGVKCPMLLGFCSMDCNRAKFYIHLQFPSNTAHFIHRLLTLTNHVQICILSQCDTVFTQCSKCNFNSFIVFYMQLLLCICVKCPMLLGFCNMDCKGAKFASIGRTLVTWCT